MSWGEEHTSCIQPYRFALAGDVLLRADASVARIRGRLEGEGPDEANRATVEQVRQPEQKKVPGGTNACAILTAPPTALCSSTRRQRETG